MRFLWYVRCSGYLLIGAGFAALLVTDEYGLLSALIFGLLLFLGWQIDSGRLRHAIPLWFWNLATLAFFAFCAADALMIRRDTSVALVNMLIALQAVKLLNPKQDRDYLALYALSFFALLISSIMTFSALFALSCLLFIATGTWALIARHLKGEIQTYAFSNAPPALAGQDDERFETPAVNALISPKFLGGTLLITLFTCVLSVVVFLILPRMREGTFFSYAGRDAPKVSGFSEEMALDSFGAIRLNHTPVMNVELPGIADPSQLAGRLYWKGVTYNHYDGLRWKADDFKRKPVAMIWRYRSRAVLRRFRGNQNALIEQRVSLMSPDYHVLFGANRLYSVEGRFLSVEFDEFTDNAKVVIFPQSPQYSAFSDMAQPSPEALRADSRDYSDDIRAAYLQLPPLAPRIEALARHIAGNLTNPYDLAVAVHAYLRQNYRYSLDVKRSPDAPPLEDFLFISNAGHCEYYATSMAILLRILGVPARVVNGFAQGRWNEFGHFFTVRQSDAHAWVEVYFPQRGWVTFDPTPPAAFGEEFQQFAERGGVLAALYRYSEYVRAKWTRYVVDYSLYDQAGAAMEAFRASRDFRRWLSALIHKVEARLSGVIERLSITSTALMLGAAAASVFALRLLLKFSLPTRFSAQFRRKRPRAVTTPRDSAFYSAMLAILARKGLVKQAHLTPGEFAQLVRRRHPLCADDVHRLTSLYYAVRFGQQAVSPDDAQAISDILRRLKRMKPAGK